MLKKLLVLVFLLAFSMQGLALISVITETQKFSYQPNERHLLNAVQPGETFSFKISNDPGVSTVNTKWSQIIVEKDSLPKNWRAIDSEKNQKVFEVQVLVAKDAEANKEYEFKVKAVDEKNLLESESIKIRIPVKKGLVSISLPETVKKTFVGEETTFNLTLVNNSIADHKLKVSSDLEKLWFEEKEFELKAGEKKEVQLKVNPRIYGLKQFKFKVESVSNGELIDLIPIELTVQPVLKKKFEAALTGLPVFSPSMLSFYLFNSFISFLFQ